MKRLSTAAFAALMLLAAHGASAAERTVTLKVDNLFCATCSASLPTTRLGLCVTTNGAPSDSRDPIDN